MNRREFLQFRTPSMSKENELHFRSVQLLGETLSSRFPKLCADYPGNGLLRGLSPFSSNIAPWAPDRARTVRT